MQNLTAFVERSLGFLMLMFGYCNPPMRANDIINEFISSPCAVSCGLLSYLFIPEVLRVIGWVVVGVGLLQVVNLYFSTVVAFSLSLLFKFSGWISGAFGRGGGGGMPQPASFGGSFSLSSAIACVAVGTLLASGEDMAASVASSLASILSGLLSSGMAFIVTTAASAMGIPFCGH